MRDYYCQGCMFEDECTEDDKEQSLTHDCYTEEDEE